MRSTEPRSPPIVPKWRTSPSAPAAAVTTSIDSLWTLSPTVVLRFAMDLPPCMWLSFESRFGSTASVTHGLQEAGPLYSSAILSRRVGTAVTRGSGFAAAFGPAVQGWHL